MEKTVSVIIPNYNGRALLEKYLASTLKVLPKAEIIIVDDASTDDSVQYLKNNFKNIKVLTLKKNSGFAQAANAGAKEATGDLLVFLNTDVKPRQGFLESTLKYFDKDDTFGVAFADHSHEAGKIVIRGKGGGRFQKGFLAHFALVPKTGETLWISGGSGIINKKKFLQLGGFDEVYAPFYWEDIDLSYRAWKSGYKCYFDLNAKVDHFHEEGAIRNNFSKSQIKNIAYTNQFLFVWKNINNELFLANHVFYFPINAFRSILSRDVSFLYGLILALKKLPILILGATNQAHNYTRSDREVLKQFEKQ